MFVKKPLNEQQRRLVQVRKAAAEHERRRAKQYRQAQGNYSGVSRAPERGDAPNVLKKHTSVPVHVPEDRLKYVQGVEGQLYQRYPDVTVNTSSKSTLTVMGPVRQVRGAVGWIERRVHRCEDAAISACRVMKMTRDQRHIVTNLSPYDDAYYRSNFGDAIEVVIPHEDADHVVVLGDNALLEESAARFLESVLLRHENSD